MCIAEIRQYATLMRELGLTALEIKTDGSVRLERAAGIDGDFSAGEAAKADASAVEGAAFAGGEKSAADGEVVTSPMVGMFYAAPTENAEPFVKPGSVVRRGDVLCIIEAMKLMNEITAEYDGEVTEVLAVNGAVVDFGQPLFRINKEGSKQ